jgi:hypothetical protein
VSAGAAVTPCCPMRRAASRTASRTVRLVALLLLARAAGGSEFPERECCDPVNPITRPPSSTTAYPTVPTATGHTGEYTRGVVLRRDAGQRHARARARPSVVAFAVAACVLIRVLRFLGGGLSARVCCSGVDVISHQALNELLLRGDSGAFANWPVLLLTEAHKWANTGDRELDIVIDFIPNSYLTYNMIIKG